MVSHDAFGYLEKYGLHFEPIAGLSPDAEPTPADLAELQDLIRDEGITTVFSETLVSREDRRDPRRRPRHRDRVLDPIEGLTDEQRRGLPLAHAHQPRGPAGGERLLTGHEPSDVPVRLTGGAVAIGGRPVLRGDRPRGPRPASSWR